MSPAELNHATVAPDLTAPVAGRVRAALMAAALGLVIVFAAGLAPIDVVHNAAHDGRHAFAMPCH